MLTLIPAKKLGMTNVFSETAATRPATVLEPYDLYVLRKKTAAKDGYFALVLAYKETTDKHITSPRKGELRKAEIEAALSRSFEVKMSEEEIGQFTLGQLVRPESFLKYWGEATVSSISKGKGFQGVMKRHNFKGVRMTHGHTIHRKPASNNATDPARVFKGSRRPGRMGNERVTVKNLSVFEYDRLHNLLVLEGTVPGPKGALVWAKMASELDKATVDAQDQVFIDTKAQEEETAEAVETEAAEVVAEFEESVAPSVESASGELIGEAEAGNVEDTGGPGEEKNE